MARENQGLQITLVVFIVLTLVLSVVAFFLYQDASEQRTQAEAAQSAQQEAESNLRTAQGHIERLKTMIGAGVETDMGSATAEVDPDSVPATVEEMYAFDMRNFGATLPPSEQTYRKVIEAVHNVAQQRQTALDNAIQATNRLKADMESLEAQTQRQMAEAEARADSAVSELADERDKFNKDRQRQITEKEQLAERIKEANDRMNIAIARANEEVDEAVRRADFLTRTNESMAEQLDEFRRPTVDHPDGKVTLVNQSEGTVWINLGTADALRRQVTFAVYDKDTNDVTRSSKKADIEVTQLKGSHLAEARVLTDEPTNPILPGDIIHTPVWSPGGKLHFALATGLDIDGDGNSDVSTIRKLIQVNGGVVDAYVEEDGRIEGEITSQTRYLVVGEQSTEETAPGIRAARTRMETDAKEHGVPKITMDRLLQMMGWKNPAPVVRMDRYADWSDKAPARRKDIQRVSPGRVSDLYNGKENPQRVSPGKVSDLFEERVPQGSRNSAF